MPNLVFIYAIIFKFMERLLFSARAFSVVCANLLIISVFFFTYYLFRPQRRTTRLLIASCSVLLLLANPLFSYTSGLAWSHDFPALVLMLAFFLQVYGARKGRTNVWIFLSGLLLGLAIGTRLTFLLASLAFGLSLAFYPGIPSKKARINLIISFIAGIFVGVLPTIILFLVSPEKFLFWNIHFVRLNTLYRQLTRYTGRMDLASKLEFLLIDIYGEPGNLLLLLSTIFFAFSTRFFVPIKDKYLRSQSNLILLLILFLTIGGLVPTPSFHQYFYAPIPFAILGCVYGLASLYQYPIDHKRNWLLVLFVQIVILTNIFTFSDYPRLLNLKDPASWIPIQTHGIGKVIKAETVQGKVLTLAPIYPLEGNLSIYPELATGPFVWRAAHLIPIEQRREYGALSGDDIEDYLAEQPPDGILTVGYEEELEEPLIDYAQQNGYQQKKLSKDLWLWVP